MNISEIFNSMSYGPAPEQSDYVHDWLKSHKEGFKLYINGKWVAPKTSEATIDSHNPATGDYLGRIAVAGADDVDAAVAAAAKAFPKWSKLPGHARAKHLYALARIIQKTGRFLSVLETLDNGKPIRESRDIDVPLVARHFYHHAGWAQLMDQELPDQEALGVVGQVIPWNFPLLMMAWKIAPAIAAGNCVVLKPAEYTSLTALYFAELCEEAGIPPGVINIVTGAGETGSHIVNHPDIAKIAFTGSTGVGRYIREATAGAGKKLTLELGGKSPFIVFEDADIDGAVEGLVDAIWFNQGQVCCAGSRLLVEEGIADRLIEKVKIRLSKFRLGNPLDKAIDMGAIVDPIQLDRIKSLVGKGAEEGAEIWQPDVAMPAEGCYYPPTLITNVSPASIVVREEIFGPVLTVMTFRTLQEAADLANNTRFGLASSVWSENINRALEVSSMIKAGVVWVNTTNQFDAACGFGGYRESGFGREGGKEGMYEYLKTKNEWLTEKGNLVPVPKATKPADNGNGLDRTAKNYVGGKQARPDGGNTLPVLSPDGKLMGRVGEGNRKDIRNAVEAAYKNAGWSSATAHTRAQVIYYIAENLSYRAEEMAARLVSLTGVSKKAAQAEVDMAVSRLFSAAGWADKFDGLVHTPPVKNVALAVNEPMGILGIVCPDVMPLLSFVSLIAPAMAMGNRSVVIPSERYPLIATDFYQILETSDLPAGVINIVTGDRESLTKTLAQHDQVDAIWYHGSKAGSEMVERESAHNLKRSWVNDGRARDWMSPHGEGRRFLREATQVKNIWLPYGD
ncbi:aldehyde dehydrogenase family protein [Paremcibacter congregatus]|uniref:aldehyde dehydrogenase family protein n=1 Tax=Paremcibacter congregatus TaxID=2043170 RepID=UPI0030ECECDF